MGKGEEGGEEEEERVTPN